MKPNTTHTNRALFFIAAIALTSCGEPEDTSTSNHEDPVAADMSTRQDDMRTTPAEEDMSAASPDMRDDLPEEDMHTALACVDEACPDAPNASGYCLEDDSCDIECLVGFADCDQERDGCETATIADAANCGGCGVECAGAENASGACVDSECALVCSAGFADCDDAPGCEADLSSTTSCGACGNTCDVLPNTTASCNDRGQCEHSCVEGFADCDDTVPGCETQLDVDSMNCGACGNACDAGPNTTSMCVDGACSSSCDMGWADCLADDDSARAPVDPAGCETPLGTTTNCAGCGDVCPSAPNAVASCGAAGVCELSCLAGYADCIGAEPGCETLTDNDVNNCGGCGVVCPGAANATATCDAGVCGLVCDAGFEDCDGAPGCEVDTTSDVSHCGACDAACPSGPNESATCSNSACQASCDQGFTDCDAMAAGCETDTDNDPLNCNGCGLTCPSGQNSAAACGAGSCELVCDAGWGDCDGDASTGCELDVTSDPLNCGACGNTCGLAAPMCISGTCSPVKRVFLTSQHVRPGDLAGIAGADAHCQTLATTAGLTGTFKAWLSDGTSSPSARFTRSTVPYMRVDGVLVANNWSDLTDGSLLAPINITEQGTRGARIEGHTSQTNFWVITNTVRNGNRYVNYTNQTCNNFTDTTMSIATANPDAADVYWTLGWTGGRCNRLFAMYCFEQ